MGISVYCQHKGVEEWYLNDPQGLEQGFTLGAPPVGDGKGDLALELSFTGPLTATLADTQTNGEDTHPTEIDFIAPDGTCVLRYGALYAYDATGRALPVALVPLIDGKPMQADAPRTTAAMTSSIVLCDRLPFYAEDPDAQPVFDGVRLLVDATGAVYPITVDPLLSSPSWTGEPDQANADYGWAVSQAGDVNGDGGGTHHRCADVIVGAPKYDNGQMNEGRAYLYLGSSNGLAVTPTWTTEGDQANAKYGIAVGTAGDVNGDGYDDIIVGAELYDNGQTNEGRAYVYHGSSTGPGTSADWTAEADQAQARFGAAVGTAGDVNADGYDDVIIGAFLYYGGQESEGRAFVYTGSANGLSTSADWTAEADQADAYFGYAVGTAGDVNGDGYADVIVGAYWYDNGQSDEGRAFVYHGSSSGLSSSADWTAESNTAYAEFGWTVGTAGDVNGDGYDEVIVGAYYYGNGQSDEGAAYVYHGSSGGLSTTADWMVESNEAYAHYGYSVGTAGDVNADGYDDIIVGAFMYYGDQADEGKVYVYTGSSGGLPTTADWTMEGNQARAHFGQAVSSAGDVNDDGADDVIIGANLYDNGQSNEGRAFVYHGVASTPITISGLTAVNDSPTALGQVTTLTATITAGTNASYAWDFGDEDTGSGAVVTHTYASAGSYTAVVTATNSTNTMTTTTQVTITAASDTPISGLVATNDSPTDLGEPTALTATITAGTNASYIWGFGDDSTGSGAVVTHTYGSAGSYTAVVTASNSANTVTATTQVTVMAATPMTVTRTITYTYDPLNRLTGATYSTGEGYAYEYDAVGNRVAMTSATPLSGTVATTYTYDVARRLTDRAVSDGRVYTYTWSHRGQMLAEYTQGVPVRTFTYDGAGQLVRATVFTLTTEFTYNGIGARVAVSVAGYVTNFALDFATGNRILAETTTTGTVQYLYGDGCLGEERDGDWLYYLPEAEGYVRQSIDEQGLITSAWLYDPNGTLLEGPEGPVSHLVCNGMYDWSTGLIYKDRRYFDPSLGIWLALLPLMVVQIGCGKSKGRRHPWVMMVLIGVTVTGTLLACSPNIDYRTVEAIVCTEIPPTAPMRSVSVHIESQSGANAQPDGSHNWQVKFQLAEKAPADGWIVQEIDVAEYKYNSDSNVWEQHNPSILVSHYWEAWQVKEGRTTRDRWFQGYDDQYAAESGLALTPPYTVGWKQVKAAVKFYTGGSKPDPIWSNVGDVPAGEGWDEGDWGIRKLVGTDNDSRRLIPAGDLPVTEIPPKFWDYCGTPHNFEIFWDNQTTWGTMRWENNVHAWGPAPADWVRPANAWYGP